MSLFRRPRGTYVRPTPDWFSANAAAVFGFGNGGTGSDPAVLLYNNDTLGRSLFVFGFGATNDGSEVVNWSFFNGPGFQLYASGNPFPIDPVIAQPVGQLYSGLTAAQDAAPPRSTQEGLYLSSSTSIGSQNELVPVFAPYPLAIVRPGWSFGAWNLHSILSAYFYYVVMAS